jgi:hypothetical protein
MAIPTKNFKCINATGVTTLTLGKVYSTKIYNERNVRLVNDQGQTRDVATRRFEEVTKSKTHPAIKNITFTPTLEETVKQRQADMVAAVSGKTKKAATPAPAAKETRAEGKARRAKARRLAKKNAQV